METKNPKGLAAPTPEARSFHPLSPESRHSVTRMADGLAQDPAGNEWGFKLRPAGCKSSQQAQSAAVCHSAGRPRPRTGLGVSRGQGWELRGGRRVSVAQRQQQR